VFIDVLMILGLCWFVSVRIITPKKELKRVIEKISDGNLNFELTEFEDKLFGDVFKNIDMMRAKLKKDLKLIKDAEKDSKLKPEEKSDKIKKVLDRYVL
jgi:methyl-accepting chemotaxis protein